MNQVKQSLRSQLEKIWPAIGLAMVFAAIQISIVLLLHFWKGISLGDLTRDPAAIFEFPPYVGFLSQTGIFIWAASAAVCLFSAWAMKGFSDPLFTRYLVFSGLLALFLGVDDVFLLHEELFPGFGVPEKVVYLIYIAFIFLYLITNVRVILKTDYLLLAMAFGFFGISIGFDFVDVYFPGQFLLEDGAKLTGMVGWLVYFGLTARAAFLQAAGRREKGNHLP